MNKFVSSAKTLKARVVASALIHKLNQNYKWVVKAVSQTKCEIIWLENFICDPGTSEMLPQLQTIFPEKCGTYWENETWIWWRSSSWTGQETQRRHGCCHQTGKLPVRHFRSSTHSQHRSRFLGKIVKTQT